MGEYYHNYYFRVRCKKGDIYSDYSNTVSVFPRIPDPSNLTLETSYPWNNVKVSFMDNSKCEDKFLIKRKEIISGTEYTFEIPGDLDINENEVFFDNVFPFKDYEYKVYGVYGSKNTSILCDTVTTSPIFSGTTGDYYSHNIQRANNGTLHMAYKYDKGDSLFVIYGFSNDEGLSWNIQRIFKRDRTLNREIKDVSIVLSSDGKPIIVFVEDEVYFGNRSRLWYFHKIGNSWYSSKLDTIHFTKDARVMEPSVLMKNDTVHIIYGKMINPQGTPIDSLYYSKFYYLTPSSFSSAKEFIDIFQNIYISNRGSFVFYKDTLHLVVQEKR